MKRFKLTLIGLVISGIILLYSVIFDADLFELAMKYLHTLEALEIDELIFPFIIAASFALIDMFKWQKEHRVEKKTIYEAMLASTLHILNNFLQKMELIKLKSRRATAYDPDILALYDKITGETIQQIRELSTIATIDEKAILSSVNVSTSNTKATTKKDALTDAGKLNF